MKRSWVLFTALILLSLMTTMCAPAATPTPQTIIQTVEVPVEKEVITTQEVIITQVVEVPAEPTDKVVVEFWTTDNEEERVDVYEQIAERFMQEHPEVDLRIVPIEEAGVSQRISTAMAANRLPDIVRMGVERVATFAADGILDEDAAVAVVENLGVDDFRAGPLNMVTNPATGKYAAIPFDGWI